MSSKIRVHSAVLHGIDALAVDVEVSVQGGLPGVTIVGMPDKAVLESRSRIQAALKACDFSLPRMHVIINLAPSELKKTGTGLDLPICVGILAASGQIPLNEIENCLFVGEIGLGGDIRPTRGLVAYALCANQAGQTLIGAPTNGQLTGVEALGVPLSNIRELKRGIKDVLSRERSVYSYLPTHTHELLRTPKLDYADVFGQELAKRALVIAAAGKHGILMVGPPGAGKTMLAKRFSSILPPLLKEEQQEAILIHSVAGQNLEAIEEGFRPYRAPHHSISKGGLLGGGRPVIPGEISLAHKGVLFLDELPEFSKDTLQSLRQPLEDHEIRLVRVEGIYTFPSDFMLIAAANPCPCGHLGDPGHICRCTPSQISSYQGKIGGPLMDRIDIHIDVSRPETSSIIQGKEGMSSKQMLEAVLKAREFSSFRQNKQSSSHITIHDLGFKQEAEILLDRTAKRLCLGGRSITKVANVARTIADMEEKELIEREHVLEAIGFRTRVENYEEVCT